MKITIESTTSIIRSGAGLIGNRITGSRAPAPSPGMPQQPPSDVVLVPEPQCLNCAYPFNALGTGDTNIPAEPAPPAGAILICINCGAIQMLDDDLTPRGLTEEEADTLCADADAVRQLAGMLDRIEELQSIVRDRVLKHTRN